MAGADWNCRHCGEMVESQFDTCWKCGYGQSGESVVEMTAFENANTANSSHYPNSLGADSFGHERDKATRICEWCDEAIPAKAKKCPRCQKWRKDIDQDRVKSYLWSASSIIPAMILGAGLREGWWYGSTGITHFAGIPFPQYGFSFKVFLSSPSGLVTFAGFALTGIMSFNYYASVSRKIGSWWWF